MKKTNKDYQKREKKNIKKIKIKIYNIKKNIENKTRKNYYNKKNNTMKKTKKKYQNINQKKLCVQYVNQLVQEMIQQDINKQRNVKKPFLNDFFYS